MIVFFFFRYYSNTVTLQYYNKIVEYNERLRDKTKKMLYRFSAYPCTLLLLTIN